MLVVRPVTQIAAMIVVVLTIIPIVLAQRLAGGTTGLEAGRES
jgi:hypothetical protein